jgi:hypothetical protein
MTSRSSSVSRAPPFLDVALELPPVPSTRFQSMTHCGQKSQHACSAQSGFFLMVRLQKQSSWNGYVYLSVKDSLMDVGTPSERPFGFRFRAAFARPSKESLRHAGLNSTVKRRSSRGITADHRRGVYIFTMIVFVAARCCEVAGLSGPPRRLSKVQLGPTPAERDAKDRVDGSYHGASSCHEN